MAASWKQPNAAPPGLREALRALKLPKRAPTDDDRPPVKPFPGRKPTLIDGQIDLFGNVYPPTPRRKRRREFHAD